VSEIIFFVEEANEDRLGMVGGSFLFTHAKTRVWLRI